MKSLRSIWHYVVDVKSTVKISSIVVAFLENMNFTTQHPRIFRPSYGPASSRAAVLYYKVFAVLLHWGTTLCWWFSSVFFTVIPVMEFS